MHWIWPARLAALCAAMLLGSGNGPVAAEVAICQHGDPVACVAGRQFLRESVFEPEALVATDRESLIREMQAIDRFADLITPDGLRQLEEGDAEGRRGAGVATFDEVYGDISRLLVVPFEGSAAETAGLDGPAYVDLPPDAARAALRAMLGGGAAVVFRNAGTANARGLRIVPEDFTIPSMEETDVDGIPALRVHAIPQNGAPAAVEAYLRTRRAGGDPQVLLDLRYARGGDMFAALDIAALFLAAETPLGTLMTRSDNAEFFAPRLPKGPYAASDVTVLVGPHTASAGEALAALMQAGGARVVGLPTFGKCAVQSVYPLGQSGAIKLTTSEYIPPQGARYYCNVGLLPDSPSDDMESVNDAIALRTLIEADREIWPGAGESRRASSDPGGRIETSTTALQGRTDPIADRAGDTVVLEGPVLPDGKLAPLSGEISSAPSGADVSDEPGAPTASSALASGSTLAVCLGREVRTPADQTDLSHHFAIALDGTGEELRWWSNLDAGLLCAVPHSGESVEALHERMAAATTGYFARTSVQVREIP